MNYLIVRPVLYILILSDILAIASVFNGTELLLQDIISVTNCSTFYFQSWLKTSTCKSAVSFVALELDNFIVVAAACTIRGGAIAAGGADLHPFHNHSPWSPVAWRAQFQLAAVLVTMATAKQNPHQQMLIHSFIVRTQRGE